MARRRDIAAIEDGTSQSLMLYTTLMLILVSFFVVLISRANFDETKYATAMSSIQSSLGTLPGGRLAIGVEQGLPIEGLSFDQEGRLVLPELEMAQIRAVLAPALLSGEAGIIHTRDKRIVSLSSELLFPLDSAELNPEAAETLLTFARIMAGSTVPIAIEGHTANLPPQTSEAGDNWDVSARRALAVLNFLAEEGGLDYSRLTAFGYAGGKPWRSNATPEGRARNRRVDLVLDFSRIDSRELEEMREEATTYNFQGFDFLLRDGREETPQGGAATE